MRQKALSPDFGLSNMGVTRMLAFHNVHGMAALGTMVSTLNPVCVKNGVFQEARGSGTSGLQAPFLQYRRRFAEKNCGIPLTLQNMQSGDGVFCKMQKTVPAKSSCRIPIISLNS
jgi:hypothetical protein